jgi:translation initiation factor 3 subunit F
VEVTNCFAVPHAERGDEVAIGKDYNKQMLALHLRANRKEVVVGWYATTASSGTTAADATKAAAAASRTNSNTTSNNVVSAMIADTSSLIHEFYASETEDGEPVHLVLDTQLSPSSSSGDDALLPMYAFQSTPVSLGGEPVANLFHQVRLVVQSSGPESICVHQMIQAMNRTTTTTTNHDHATTNITDGETTNHHHHDVVVQDDVKESPTASLLVSMERLYELLDTASRHVDAVVAGRQPTENAAITPEVGRQIAATLSTVPRVRPDVFDRLFHDSLQDLLMVTYLSNITRTQLTIAEKLNACLGI